MAGFDIQSFSTALLSAVEDAQMGFFFEEGGCWGMAAALHSLFVEKAMPVKIRYSPAVFVHAWVEIEGVHLDYQGTMTPLADAVELSREQLKAIARKHGWSEEEFYSMCIEAESIVAEALSRTTAACERTLEH